MHEELRKKDARILDDLVVSTSALCSQVAKIQERERILTVINNEEISSNNSYITYDRLRKLLAEPK